MEIKTILAKIAKGEALTDDEKVFVGGYDPQADIDKASAAARRKAEKDAQAAAEKVAELTAALEEAKNAKPDTTKDDKIAKLVKQVEALTAAKAEADAKVKANERMTAIRAAAKANGCVVAAGISADIFDTLLDRAVGDVDVADADALKGALDAFKAANPAMIADGGHGGIGVKGVPAGGIGASAKNPWKAESLNLTEQMRLLATNPTEANRLAAEAGVDLTAKSV